MALMVGYGISGSTHDFFAYDASGNVWNGAAFVTFSAGSYTTYRVTATETSTTGRFTGTLPTDAVAYELRLRSGTLAGSVVVSFVEDVTNTSVIVSQLGGAANLNIYSPAIGSDIEFFKGDDFSSPDTIAYTKTSGETHWPTTLSNVYFWALPTDRLLNDDSTAAGLPVSQNFSSVSVVGTAVTGTLPSSHGLVTGVHVVTGLAWPGSGYFTVTISSNTATWTLPVSVPLGVSLTGVKIQPGIACTVTQATGSSQAFTFAPTSAQLQRISTIVDKGYTGWFVANAVTKPRVLRSGTLTARRSPTGT